MYYPFVCLISRLELVIEEKIDYNDLAELILDESTRAKPKEKALDSDMNGTNSIILNFLYIVRLWAVEYNVVSFFLL